MFVKFVELSSPVPVTFCFAASPLGNIQILEFNTTKALDRSLIPQEVWVHVSDQMVVAPQSGFLPPTVAEGGYYFCFNRLLPPAAIRAVWVWTYYIR